MAIKFFEILIPASLHDFFENPSLDVTSTSPTLRSPSVLCLRHVPSFFACLCEQTHIATRSHAVLVFYLMRNPSRTLSQFYRWLVSIFSVFLFTKVLLAGPAPQFAFSINSAQIPGGIWPISLGMDSSSNLYISSLSTVVKLARNGSYLSRWGSQGSGPGQFSYSGPIGFDSANNIYVIDDYNDRVEKFDSDSNFLEAWGTNGTAPGQFDYPEGLAVDSAGQVYVSDSMNSRIEVFSSSGSFITSFGSMGTNVGEFSFSGPIAIDSSDHIYVADFPGDPYDNFRVQKFDVNGTFLTEWAAHGTNPDPSAGLQVPAMTTDPSNNVYVVDGTHDIIQKFTSDGVFVAQWGSLGTGPGQFDNPMGIAIDPSGNYVYVADYYNARVNVFAYSPLEPVIYQSPTNQTVPAGTTLTLAAGVFGAQPLSYQWQYFGTNIPGATNALLVFSNATLDLSGPYALIVSNSLGNALSSNATISVLPVVVTTLAPTGISATGAVLNGSASLGSNPSSVWFEWGTNTAYGNSAGLTNLSANTNFHLSQTLTSLSGALIYHYRLAGSNGLGIAYGEDAQVQVGLKPVVVTLQVTAAGPDSVVLNASVNPEGRDTSVFFRWGISNPYAHNTPTNQIGGDATPVAVQTQITGLTSGYTYAVQAVASNELGTVSGAIMNFVAPPWTLLPSPSGIIWKTIAASADGGRIAALAQGNRIYLSTNSGMAWTSSVVPSESWQAGAMSADGARLIVAAGGNSAAQPGPAYFSTNGGNSWTKAATPDRTWYALAASGDGLKVGGVDLFGQRVLTSTNGGLNWATNTPPVSAMWSAIASSADGQRLIVAAGGISGSTNGPLYTSSDSGLSWTSNNLPNQYWRSVASSADGQTLLAAVGGRHAGPIYLSTNAGATWVITSAPSTNWQSVAISADGSKFAAIESLDAKPVYLSTDSGFSWQTLVLPQALWTTIVSSADGARLFAVGDQDIMTLQTTPSPGLETKLVGAELLLSWIIPSAPFQLQHATSFPASQWSGLINAPILVFTNLHYQAAVPATDAVGFYRLNKIP
jgi:sugar lactone lactonase YvrE